MTRANKKPIEGETLLDQITTRHEAEDHATAQSAMPTSKIPQKRGHKSPQPEPSKKGEIVPADAKAVASSRMEATADSPVVKIMEIMERMTINPAVDASKLAELYAIQKDALAVQAKRDFDAALLRAKRNIPIIGKNKRTDHKGTSRSGKEYDLKASYATWDAIREIVDPILASEDIFLTHRLADGKEPGSIRVIAELKGHGHREEAAFLDLPPEGSGSKNAVQARGSSISYGERYTGCAALGIATREEDDDGSSSGRPLTVGEPINEQQLEKIIEYAAAVECPEAALVSYLNSNGRPNSHPIMERIVDLSASRFKHAMDALKLWERNRIEEKAAR